MSASCLVDSTSGTTEGLTALLVQGSLHLWQQRVGE